MKNQELYVSDVIRSVPALVTQNEGELLFSLPKIIPKNGVIVEIGSYKGGSTILLAQASILEGKGRVYAVDSHIRDKLFSLPLGYDDRSELHPLNTWPFFKNNIEKYKVDSHITPLVVSSAQAAKGWDKPISLLWIDGDHEYDGVRKDFLLWEKHLIRGGIIAFHDSAGSSDENYLVGPRAVVKKYVLNSNRFTDVRTVDTITYARKTKNLNILQNIYFKFLIIVTNKFNLDRSLGLAGIF